MAVGPKQIAAMLGLSALIGVAAGDARAENSMRGLFEKYQLMGTFAFDCTKPATEENTYFVNRLLDDNHVQRDRMVGPTKRDAILYLDKAQEVKPNEITVSGTRDGKPTDSLWRIERGANDASPRMLVVDSNWGGDKLLAGGKVTKTGKDYPWLNRCGG